MAGSGGSSTTTAAPHVHQIPTWGRRHVGVLETRAAEAMLTEETGTFREPGDGALAERRDTGQPGLHRGAEEFGAGRTAATRRTSATSSVISHGRISEVRRVEGVPSVREKPRASGHREGLREALSRGTRLAHARGSGRNAVPGGAVI
jgi:hypothetical protein